MHCAPQVIIVIGPSCSGKGSLIKALLTHFNKDEPRIEFSVSVTDRAPRKDDIEGVTYHFVTPYVFEVLRVHGAFLEHAGVYGKRYGTLHQVVIDALADGRSILLEVDPQGADEVLRVYPDAVTIFVDAPSPEVLRQRLITRGDPPEVVAKRMADYPRFGAARNRYRYLIINDIFEDTRDELISIVGRALAA